MTTLPACEHLRRETFQVEGWIRWITRCLGCGEFDTEELDLQVQQHMLETLESMEEYARILPGAAVSADQIASTIRIFQWTNRD